MALPGVGDDGKEVEIALAAFLSQDHCPALFLLTFWPGLLQERKFMPGVTGGDEV